MVRTLENGMVLPETHDRKRYVTRDSDEHLYYCEYCDGLRTDAEMSDIRRMCWNCYEEAIKKLRAYVEAQDDNAVLEVFCNLTN